MAMRRRAPWLVSTRCCEQVDIPPHRSRHQLSRGSDWAWGWV